MTAIQPLPFRPDVASLEAWLGALPMMNPARAGAEVLAALEELRDAGLEPRSNLDLLDRIAETAVSLARTFEQQFLTALMPYPPTLRQQSQLSRALYAVLARSYRSMALCEAFLERNPRGADDSALPARLLYRALMAYYHEYLRAAEEYQVPEPKFWREIYDLYGWGERHALLARVTGDTLFSSAGQTSPAEAFKRIALFSLSNYVRYTQREMWRTHELLAKYGQHAVIDTQYAQSKQVALFFFNVDTDNPPEHVSRLVSLEDSGNRFVFTRDMVQAVLADLPPLDPKRGVSLPEAPERQLVRRLLRSLGAPEQRKRPRFKGQDATRVLVGLDAAIAEFKGTAPDEVARKERKENEDRLLWHPTFLDLEPQIDDVASREDLSRVRAESSLLELVQGESRAQSSDAAPRRPKDPTPLQARIQDTSLTGCGLIFEKLEDSTLRVGDVVGLVRDEAPPDMGLIRWLRSLGADVVAAGVELLPVNGQWAEVNSATVRDQKADGLLFPAEDEDTPYETLLLDTIRFQVGDLVLVKTAGGEPRKLRLGRIIETSPTFAYFLVMPVTG